MSKFLSHLECGHCEREHEADRLNTVCVRCGGPLLARYRLDSPGMPSLEKVLARPAGPDRFWQVLPALPSDGYSLGEGATPLIRTYSLGENVWIKDESQNPTGSFKARGMAVAIARACELGVQDFCLPSNGNAGGAAAAYAAFNQVVVEIAMPANTPRPLVEEARAYGAYVTLVDGTIADCGRLAAEWAAEKGYFNLATLAEPYRIEGKKMMGYELFWDLGGRVPDVILYPTGGGTGLVGMAKAFDEMEELGWIGRQRPRMVAVQVEGCAPIVRAFHAGADHAEPWRDPEETKAYGLRVPSALGDRLMLSALRKTHGTAVAVYEGDMLYYTEVLAKDHGVWGSPEGGACLVAYRQLKEEGWIKHTDTVVIFNTGSALKYLES
ncbi:MAG: threonine synthase [Acidimicrobiia bacterium]